MKRVASLCSSAVVVLGLLPSCLLPAVDDGSRARDGGPPRQEEATSGLAAGADAGSRVACGTSDAACCERAPTCESQTCASGACAPLVMRAAYSHRQPNHAVDILQYIEFSATKRSEARPLLTRPTISSIVGSRDGSRLAFLASASTVDGAPTVVWLIDGVDGGAEPAMVESSNTALSRTLLMADANLDYLLSCTKEDYCGVLELYRRNERTFTTIATNVWSAVVGYDNGLLVYLTEDDPLSIYWLDLSESDAEPQLLMAVENETHYPFIGPASLSQTGRTFTYIDAIALNYEPADLNWTVFGTQLGQTDPVALQSGLGLISVYTQRDGASALVVPTDIQGRHTRISRYPVTGSVFGAEQGLFNKELEQEINPGSSANDIALSPLLDTYDTHFYFFGAPQSIIDGNVFLTPQVLKLDGSAPLVMTDESCRVYTSGRDMLSPRIELTAQSTAAALGWMRCNQEVGYINLDQANSFTAVDQACAGCSPGKHFEALGEGVVYSNVDASAVSTPYYYVTSETPPLELIASGAQSGKVQSLFVARSDEQLSPWREAWHLGGAVGLSLPRSWRKRSTTIDDQPAILAGPTVHLGDDPITTGGVRVSVSIDTTSSPKQTLTALDERNQCATLLGSDAGAVTRNGVDYAFYSELRMNCSGSAAPRWFLVLRASDHSVQLVFHDAKGTGQSDFEQMSATLRVETSRLEIPVSQSDAGVMDQ